MEENPDRKAWYSTCIVQLHKYLAVKLMCFAICHKIKRQTLEQLCTFTGGLSKEI